MKIETKFNCQDTVFFMKNNQVVEWEVLEYAIKCDIHMYCQTKCSIEYVVTIPRDQNTYLFKESQIFWTKEELLKTL